MERIFKLSMKPELTAQKGPFEFYKTDTATHDTEIVRLSGECLDQLCAIYTSCLTTVQASLRRFKLKVQFDPVSEMKLGDKMTTVEACNVWTDVCTRKTRPPRIGDIPRHVAVDEESPGASSSQLPVSPPPNVTNSVVKPPSGSEGDAGAYPTPAEASEQHVPLDSARPRISNFLQGGPRVLERIIRVDGRQSLAEKIRLNRSSSQDSGICRSSVVSTLLLVKQKLSNTIGKSLESRRTNRPAALRPNRPQSRVTQDSVDLPEAPSSRKDSAVCLEDPGDTDSAPSRREVPILHATPCCEGRKSLPRHIRPRRESSGYFSNLSTFDDDRRCSTTLEAPPGQSVLRERRRSSTRMPTTEVYRKVSTAGLEMPDIQELKEIREDLRSFSKDDLTCLGTVGSLGDIGTSKSRRLQDVLHELSERSVEKDFEEVSERLSQTILSSESVRTTTQNLDSTHRVAEKILTRSDSCRASDKSISASPNSSPRSQRHRKRVVHQYSSPSSPLELERIPEKPQDHVEPVVSTRIVINDDDDDVVAGEDSQLPRRVDTSEDCESKKFLPRPVKVYQLLSTQSEDRGDGEPRLTDRRTSLQICRPEDEETLPRAGTLGPQRFLQVDGGSLEPLAGDLQRCEPGTLTVGAAPVRKLSSPEEVLSPRIVDDPGVAVRPIYPYCPYSPYASPQGSPRNRRRPLRESRRVSIDDSQGALQLNQYKLLDNIGQGSFGIVKLAYNEEDGTHYAMKILSKKKLMKKAGIFGRMAPSRKGVSSPLAKVYREIALLKKLDHPNVVKLVEVLDDPDEDNLYLVFELVERGEVLQLPTDKPLDEETARTNFRDVVLGVEYLHYQRIVHRDIKPSNLLVDSEGHVKIADLGVSAELRASGELLAGCAGTPAFSAPETTIPGAQYSGTLCDVWSMGVTLYTLVTGRVPWDGAGSIIGVQAAVRSEPLRFPEHPQLSDTLRDLISRMLHKDPASRCNLDDIKAHVWLTDDGKHPLPNQADNCRLPVTVTDEEVARVVTRVPKLDTLILIKTMLKQHSFQNPFLPRRVVKPTSATPSKLSVNQVSCTRDQVRHQQDLLKSMRTEEFHRAGRSNSAPDSYDWQVNGRQVSVDTSLPPVTEVAVQEVDVESR